jgi:hypothetical protein
LKQKKKNLVRKWLDNHVSTTTTIINSITQGRRYLLVHYKIYIPSNPHFIHQMKKNGKKRLTKTMRKLKELIP